MIHPRPLQPVGELVRRYPRSPIQNRNCGCPANARMLAQAAAPATMHSRMFAAMHRTSSRLRPCIHATACSYARPQVASGNAATSLTPRVLTVRDEIRDDAHTRERPLAYSEPIGWRRGSWGRLAIICRPQSPSGTRAGDGSRGVVHGRIGAAPGWMWGATLAATHDATRAPGCD